jgi:two-component sensor histidine kinase
LNESRPITTEPTSLRPLPERVRTTIDDISRLEVLAALDVMDTPPDGDFDRLTRLAARLFGAKFALVTLIDGERQFFKSCFGVAGVAGSPVEASFCAFTIADPGDHLVIPDMHADARFRDNPFVTGWPGVRFYVGAPLIVRGQRLGTLCVLDTEPRAETAPELVADLIDLAASASTLIELKDEARVRARTAAELLREQWRHALTLEAGRVGSWVWDLQSGVVTCNDIFRQMYGLPEAGPVHVEAVLDSIDEAARISIQTAIEQALDDESDYAEEMMIGRTQRWILTRGRVYERDPSGRAMVMMGVSLDITDSKINAQQTRLLLRELNHRVKNTLAQIQSIARQTMRQTTNPQAFIDAFSGRLRTLSDVHVKLADRDWAGVRLDEVLGGQFGADFRVRRQRLAVEGADLLLPADHALGLALVLHELATNALLYGAWSNDHGVVRLDWRPITAPVTGLLMRWRETGGPPVHEPADSGLGLRLIERSLAKVLDSRVDLRFAPTGIEVDILLPLPETAQD